MAEAYQAHVRCNTQLRVRQDGPRFLIDEPCPIGEGFGLEVVALLDKCKGCPKGATQTTELSQQQPTPAPAEAQPLAPAEALQPDAVMTSTGVVPLEHGERRSSMITLPEEAPVTQPTELPNELSLPAVSTSADYQAPGEGSNLIPLDQVILPSGLTLNSANKEIIDVSPILDTIPGCPHGSSEGGLSPHKLHDAECDRRAYLSMVLGMVPQQRRIALEYGTLFHAVLAMRYLHGGERQWEPCERVAQAGGADMAYNVKRLLSVQFDKYAQEEWKTWCPRAVEYNMVTWVAVKDGAKTVYVPLSCRIDLVLAKKHESEPHPGPGPVPQGVYLVDWKTCSWITKDLIEGYGRDYQFLTQSAIFRLGNYEQVFGPLRGIIVGLAAKKRKDPIFDDIMRIEAPMPPQQISEFIEDELKPEALRIYKKLCDPDERADMHRWPKDSRHCVGRYGQCDFFDYCDRGAACNYKIDSSRIVTPDWFAKPPKGWVPEDGGTQVAVENKKKRTKKVKGNPSETPNCDVLAKSIELQISTIPGFEKLRKENFLTPGHTYQSVQRQLGQSLKTFYEGSAAQKVKFNLEAIEWRFQKTGCAWQDAQGNKGRVSWGAVSDWICRHVWFDLSKAEPE